MQQSRSEDLTSAGADGGPSIGSLILHRKWLLLFGLSTGVALGYLYFTQQAPVYRSSAQLLVTRGQNPLPQQGVKTQESHWVDPVETQCLVLTSPSVIAAAVDRSQLGRRPEFGSRDVAIGRLVRGLAAEPAGKHTEVINISYQGSTPDECRSVIEAIFKAYREFLGQTEQDVSIEMRDLIVHAKDELSKEVKALETEYAAFRSQAPLLWNGEQGINPHAARLTEVEGQRTALILQESQLQAKLDAVRDALARGGNRQALMLMLEQLREGNGTKSETASATATAAEKMFPLLLERELLRENLGMDHPKVQAVTKQIDMTRNHLDSVVGGERSEAPKDLLEVYLDSLKYEIETIKTAEARLVGVYAEQKKAAQEIDASLTRDSQLRQEMSRKGRLLDVVVKQLEEMSLFGQNALRMQVIAEPGPGQRTSFQMNRFMGIGGFLGLLFAGGLAYLIEASDRSFRSPEDVREQVGAAVVGHVPVIPESRQAAVQGLSPTLCTIHKPKAQPSEAFRLVRTALFFAARTGNLKVFQVTSPDQGDGKSTVSANIAVTIAQSGRRTLLVDADMRRPTVHRLFGLKGEVGLAGVLAGSAEPADAIVESGIPTLDVLTSGGRPHNPAELLSSERFDEFLGWARDRYDFVIIDTPPVLAVSDPGNVAAKADGVLLALRLNKRSRGKAAEAREILDRSGANLLGVVINGINAKGEYGYRAAYRYTYSSGYRYRYGYSYSYGANDYVEGAGRKEAGIAELNGNARALQSDRV